MRAKLFIPISGGQLQQSKGNMASLEAILNSINFISELLLENRRIRGDVVKYFAIKTGVTRYKNLIVGKLNGTCF